MEKLESEPQVHHMGLNADAMERMRSGEKTIEVCLNDAKRQKIREGDFIVFEDPEDATNVLQVKVIALLPFGSFTALIEKYPSEEFFNKKKTDQELLNSLVGDTNDSFYTQEQEKEHGVIGIMVEPIE